MAEPLAVLLQLHQQSIEAERRSLVDALESWSVAQFKATAIRRAIARETAGAAVQGGGDDLVEAFAAWLPHAKAELAAAETAESDAEAIAVRQRASLAAARASARAIETVLEHRAAARLAINQRQLQTELDAAGLRSHGARTRSNKD